MQGLRGDTTPKIASLSFRLPRFVFVKDIELVRAFLSEKIPVLNCFGCLGPLRQFGRYEGEFHGRI